LFDLEFYSKNDKPNILLFSSTKKMEKKFVIKELFSCGGEGVYFEPKDLNNTNKCFIYQEFVEIDKRKIKFIDTNNEIKEEIFYYSFDPYFFFDEGLKQGNILLRFSKNKKLNVEANGGVGFWTII